MELLLKLAAVDPVEPRQTVPSGDGAVAQSLGRVFVQDIFHVPSSTLPLDDGIGVKQCIQGQQVAASLKTDFNSNLHLGHSDDIQPREDVGPLDQVQTLIFVSPRSCLAEPADRFVQPDGYLTWFCNNREDGHGAATAESGTMGLRHSAAAGHGHHQILWHARWRGDFRVGVLPMVRCSVRVVYVVMTPCIRG